MKAVDEFPVLPGAYATAAAPKVGPVSTNPWAPLPGSRLEGRPGPAPLGAARLLERIDLG